MRTFILLLGVCFTFLSSVKGQLTAGFTNVAFDQGIYNYYSGSFFGNGVSFYDFNEDGWDDLTLTNQSDAVYLFKNVNGIFEIWQSLQVPNSKTAVWGDINNDGDNELIISTLNHGLRLYAFDENGYLNFVPDAFDWTIDFPSTADFWLYGISLADINADHLLDLVAANYNFQDQNFLFLNNGESGFQLYRNNALKYDYKASFQPAFIDLNKDNKPDLYMANDFGHGNDFYWNQIGTNDSMPLWKQSEATGLGIQLNSMCNSWSDYDNDGDLDVYVSNLEPGNQLLQNNGNNHFENIAEQINVAIHRQCWSSLWIDTNNDQWTDLLASSANADWPITNWPSSLLLGTGEGLFSDPDTTIFTHSAFTACKGDINQDGLYDIAMNASNEDFFQLYQNTTTSNNHFIKFRLNGTISNRNGVGTHYYLYTNNNLQYGYTQSGDNYLGQNSQNLILGLGDNAEIDSLILIWPSGLVDKYYNFTIDQFHNLYEGQSQWGLVVSSGKVCSNQDSIFAFIQPQFGVIWDNLSNADSAWFFTGDHEALIQFEGINIDTILFTISLFNSNGHTTTIVPEHCLAQDGAISITFENDTLFNAIHLSDGTFIANYMDNNGCSTSDTLIVPSDDVFAPLISMVPATCQMGSTGSIIIPEQTATTYTINPWIDISVAPVGTYQVHFINENGCTSDTTINILAQWEWNLLLPEMVSICSGQLVFSDNWVESNLDVLSVTNWPTEVLTADTTLNVVIETNQGCVAEDSIHFQIITPPNYNLAQENQADGALVTLQNVSNGQVYFETNLSLQILCGESQWLSIISNQGDCQWTDSVWINVEIPQSIDNRSLLPHWLLDGNQLTCVTAGSSQTIIKIVNALGQNLPFRQNSQNQWVLNAPQFPIFILTEHGWVKAKVANG